MRPRPLGDYGLLLSLSVIWGGTFSVIKIAVESVGPVSVAAGRIAVAAAILYLAVRATGERLPTVTTIAGRRTWLHFLAVGMLGNGIPFTLISWGETRVSSSLAAILIGVMPVFTAALAKLSGVEAHIGARRVTGIALGLAALTVLMGPAALGEIGGGAALAQLAVTAAAASYAATAVYAKKLSFTVPTLTLAAGTMTACALVMVPAGAVVGAALAYQPVRRFARRGRHPRRAADRARLDHLLSPAGLGRADLRQHDQLPDPGDRHTHGRPVAGRGS